jgi:hypothetical protein
MKKEELKTLILECNRELTEESKSDFELTEAVRG